MKTIIQVILVLATFAHPIDALAQNTSAVRPVGTSDREKDGIVSEREPGSLSASGLLGTVVVGAKGQRVGTVRDLLIDRMGRVTTVTVDVGDFLGIPTKTVALASRSLRFVPAGPSSIENAEGAADGARVVLVPGIGMVDHIEVDLTQQQLEAAPAYGD